jgi:steroid delta-isomerase-like uncharacterized protein
MDHVATVRRFYDLISAGDLDGFGELLADDFVEHEALPIQATGREAPKQLFTMFRAGFPDMRFAPDEVLPSGDKVVVRARVTGTHQGEFMGIPPTGKSIDVPVIDIIRFGDDGLAHEHWGIFDQMKLMQQLGVAPGPGGPPA